MPARADLCVLYEHYLMCIGTRFGIYRRLLVRVGPADDGRDPAPAGKAARLVKLAGHRRVRASKPARLMRACVRA